MPRKKWRSKIVLEDEFGDGLVYLYSKDISEGGLYLEAPPPLRVGSLAFLSFRLPGQRALCRVTGEVVRFVEKEKAGIGIRFLEEVQLTF